MSCALFADSIADSMQHIAHSTAEVSRIIIDQQPTLYKPLSLKVGNSAFLKIYAPRNLSLLDQMLCTVSVQCMTNDSISWLFLTKGRGYSAYECCHGDIAL